MKGSQGLEALATLCGGASKAPDNESPQQNDHAQQPMQTTQLNGNHSTGTQSQVSLPHQLDHFANSSASFSRSSNEANPPQPQQNQSLNQINPQFAALLNAGLAQQNMPNKSSDGGALALQQMVYLNLLQSQNQNVSNLFNQQPQQQQQQQSSSPFVDQNALTMLLALQQQAQQHEAAAATSTHHFQNQLQQQHETQSPFTSIIPTSTTQSNHTPNLPNNMNNGIKSQGSFQAPHPKIKGELPLVSSSSGTPLHQPILRRHPQGGDVPDNSAHNESPKVNNIAMRQANDNTRDRSNSVVFHPEEKKLAKRAANRRSAQLSRKRKKQYIEDLKDENSDLRRMELILRSIPDLVVSFDSSGKIGFVSRSVVNFLSFTPEELEGKSFWERLCEDSVRLLKAAFMDALAARENESNSTPLGDGVWELRLLDKNKENVMVTLNGVVHFTGDAPECVCSIRLSDGTNRNSLTPKLTNTTQNLMKPAILPQQSVFNATPMTQHGFKTSILSPNQPNHAKENIKNRRNPNVAAQISDADSSSACD